MAILTHEHHGHGEHGHDHEGAVGPHTHLTSVGIDIGSSTSHLMFSQLLIGYPSVLQRKPIVLERNVIARSPMSFSSSATPDTFSSNVVISSGDTAVHSAATPPAAQATSHPQIRRTARMLDIRLLSFADVAPMPAGPLPAARLA